MCLFLMSQGSFSPKIRFLGQQRTPFQGFTICFQIFLQPIKERSNHKDMLDGQKGKLMDRQRFSL